MFRLRAIVNGVPGTPYYLTQYFDGIDGLDAQVAWGAFLQTLRASMSTAATIRMESDIVAIDPVTGDIINVTAGVSNNWPGLLSGEIMPTQVQALCRVTTDTVAGGRRLQGRQYIPALLEEASGNGSTLTTTRKSDLQQAYSGLLTAADSAEWDPVVWSRVNGSVGIVTNMVVQDELATMRTRGVRG